MAYGIPNTVPDPNKKKTTYAYGVPAQNSVLAPPKASVGKAYSASVPTPPQKPSQSKMTFGMPTTSNVPSPPLNKTTGKTWRESLDIFAHDPKAYQKEKSRVEQSILNGTASDMDAARHWLKQIEDVGVPAPPVKTAVPAMPDYAQIIHDQLEQERQRKERAMQESINLANTQYNRLRTNIGQDRVLANVQMDRQLNPFSGRTNYARGLTNMERERTDREMQEDLSNRIASIQAGYTDFVDNMPTLERQRLMEQENQAWQRAVTEAGLTGQFNGGMTLDAQNQFWNQQFQQNQANAQNQQWQQSFNLQQAQQEWNQAFQQGQFDLQKAQQAWENAFQEKSFEQSVKQAAQSLGLDWERLNQQQQQFVADMAFKQKAFDADQQNAADQQAFDAANPDTSDFVEQLQSMYVDQYTGQVRNPDAVMAAIISRGFPDNITDQLLTMFGIPTN